MASMSKPCQDGDEMQARDVPRIYPASSVKTLIDGVPLFVIRTGSIQGIGILGMVPCLAAESGHQSRAHLDHRRLPTPTRVHLFTLAALLFRRGGLRLVRGIVLRRIPHLARS